MPASSNYRIDNTDSSISISGDTLTANQSTFILLNGNTYDIGTISGSVYQGDEFIFYDGKLALNGDWSTIDGASGEVTINNNASAAIIAYTKTKEIRGISNGATINLNANDIVGFDEITETSCINSNLTLCYACRFNVKKKALQVLAELFVFTLSVRVDENLNF